MFDDQLEKDVAALIKAHNALVATVDKRSEGENKVFESIQKSIANLIEEGKTAGKQNDDSAKAVADLEATVKKLTARLSYLETMYNKMKK